jgi:hypothetical protein
VGNKSRKKRRIPRRDRLGTPEKARNNLKGISAAQSRSRKQKKRLRRNAEETEITEPVLPIIENITKSEQAWLNELRRVRRPEDLDDFE